ncbi:MAG: T9SS type A sorting domain-containing protein, partial [Bacteroidota bacterium]
SNYTPQAGDQVEVISASKEITNPFLNQVSNDWFANYNTPNLGSFTISYLAALPVELLDFYGRLEGKAISLDWSTASEVNNLGFTIQRSQDTRNWTQLAFVAGVGNSTVLQSYEYWDRFPRPGINYYRLQQMDDNGEVHYSKVISVAFAMELQAMHIHPNPSIEWVQLDWPLPTEKEIAIQLLDQRGLVVLRTQLERGQRQLRIDMSNLTAGLYTLHVNEGVRRISKKLVKQGL